MPTYIKQTENLLCNLVHDLRQPLGNIEISAYLLREGIDSSQPSAREFVDAIERQVDVASRLLSEAVSEWSRLRAESLEPEALAVGQ